MTKTVCRSIGRILSTGLLLVFFAGTVWAQQLTVNVKNGTLEQVLKQIHSQTGYRFTYTDAINAKGKTVTVNVTDADPQTFFKSFFKENDLDYRIDNKQVYLTPAKKSDSQLNNKQSQDNQKTLRGKVTDETGEPLVGVYVKNENSTALSTTDADGNYAIKADEGDKLVFTYVGMETYTATAGKNAVVNVAMRTDAIALENVVITGYQTISKERSAGSYAVVTTEKIEKKLQTNIMDRLEGMMSGMQMYKGKPVIRGTSTIYADQSPLYVVDGVPFEGDINLINPNDIENVSVLKDATAASIYGARSTNGVIVITTRNGKAGKLKVNYNGTVSFQPLAKRSYANLMSSEEFIDFQTEMFNKGVAPSTVPDEGYAMNTVYRLLFDKRDGVISDDYFNKEISRLKKLDRYDQVVDEMLNKTSLTHQHNLAFSGGSNIYKYSFTLNYTGTNPHDKGQYVDKIGFNVKNNFDFTKWLRVDVGLMGNASNDSYHNGAPGTSFLDSGQASYYMLRDENGDPAKWEYGKSLEEVDRLNSLGLQDESYYPLLENKQALYQSKTQYLNFNLGTKFKILDNLNLELRYQTEKGNGYTKNYWTKDAYSVKTMINDATVINQNGTKTYNIPLGGQVRMVNRYTNSYTMRAQINYHDTFANDHYVTVLAGAERRKVTTESNGSYLYGYDDYSLASKNVNEAELAGGIYGTEAVGGYYFHMNRKPAVSSTDDRYVSFYANASYTYKERLGFTASIRMDQSNLFGTNPKYQYRPLWSLGANYQILKGNEVKNIDRLSVRATYGINGNVYRKSGPYIISEVSRWSNWNTNESYAQITSPPNSALRWEKTNTVNLGVDFGFFGNRLNGSLEYYYKKTTDLLGNKDADPTLGWSSLFVNYGSMRNTGVELVLESVNINKNNFRWSTSLMFSYNSNKITDIQNAGTSAYSYIKDLNARKGKPFNSLYSIRYAGLDENGKARAYKKDGTIIYSTNDLDPEDLVYSGVYDPPYSASMNNTFSFKGFDLSFMLVYYGGHVMRDVMSSMYLYDREPHYGYTSNMDRLYLKHWRNPGDENDRHMLPAYNTKMTSGERDLWCASDVHIQKADYVKLKDITLSYTFPERWVSKLHVSGLRLIFSAQDLHFWAPNRNNLNPETWSSSQLTYASRGSDIPPTYTIGINLNF